MVSGVARRSLLRGVAAVPKPTYPHKHLIRLTPRQDAAVRRISEETGESIATVIRTFIREGLSLAETKRPSGPVMSTTLER